MCPLVLLEPDLPTDGACRLLGAGIATLAHAASGFAWQEDREHGPVDSTLLEPDPRQFSRGVDLRTTHIRQAARGASLYDLYKASSDFFLSNRLEQQVRRHQCHQRQSGECAE